MGGKGSPELSVVIVADGYETIRKTIAHIREQTVRDRIELVIVTPAAAEFRLDADAVDGFHGVRLVEAGPLPRLTRGQAIGIREASAPVIVFVETHVYPQPGWAEALIRAHRQPWAAVGPVFENANPGHLLSWANFFIDYGPYIEPNSTGRIEHLPGHNSAYKRTILMQYGRQLEQLLNTEHLLHEDLIRRGYELAIEPDARVDHLNITRLSSWLPERFYTGRRFAGDRAKPWTPLRRLLFSGGSFLIPCVRLPRVLHDVRRSARKRDLLPQILPHLIIGLVASSVGEMIGYLFGIGDAPERSARLELHKERHVTAHDRQTLEAGSVGRPLGSRHRGPELSRHGVE
jgi:hypothetical protein